MEVERAAVFTGGALEESKTSDQPKAGTEECPYKLAVVGGGPSGCSIIIRAIRIGFESDLCGFCHREPQKGSLDSDGKSISLPEYPTDVAGVCLIDAGSASRFGGGKLQDYVINANTWATKFVTNVIEEKPDVLPRETVIKTPLQRLGETHTAVGLKSFGCKPAPLQMVGAFLREAGTIVQETLNLKYPHSSKVMMESSITAIRRAQLPVLAGDPSAGSVPGWKLTVRSRKINPPGGLSPKRTLPSVEYVTQEFFAHKVALATGGLQALPRLPSATHNRKLISSDFAVTEAGVVEIKARLAKAATQGVNGRAAGRVVIVGGSHSSFSSAWICLHKLKDAIGKETPSSAGCNNASQESKVDSASSSSKVEEHLYFCQSGICIVHKSNIKVFYCTKADADRDGYSPDTPSVSVSGSFIKQSGVMMGGGSTQAGQKGWVRGQIHPFGGLRGDAKDLWRSVKNGTEARVRLLQVRNSVITLPSTAPPGPSASSLKQQSIVEKLFDDAVVIIWACGYSSNLQGMAVEDEAGKPIALKYKCGQVEVDDNARVVAAEVPNQTRIKLAKHLVETPSAVEERVPALASSPTENKAPLPVFSPPPSPAKSRAGSFSLISPANTELVCEAVPTSPVSLPVSPGARGKASDPSTPGTLPPPFAAASPLAGPTASVPTAPPAPSSAPVVEGLMGSGLGFGLQAVTESGLPDGSSGRADGVAVYLKRGATLILSQVLGSKVFGGPGVHTWEDRSKLLKKMALVSASKEKAETPSKQKLEEEDLSPLRIPLPGNRSPQRRPNTTAGTSSRSRTPLGSSFSTSSTGHGVSKNAFANSLDSAQSSVLRRVITSRDIDCQSPGQECKGSGTCKSSSQDETLALKDHCTPVAFPAVSFPDRELGNQRSARGIAQVRPRTTAAVGGRSNSLLSSASAPTSAQQKKCLVVAAGAAAAVTAEDTALRAVELVNKVALLAQDLELLQLNAAREFISMSPGKNAGRTATEAGGAGEGAGEAVMENIYPAAPSPDHVGSYSSPRKVKPVGVGAAESPSIGVSAANIIGGQIKPQSNPLAHTRPNGVQMRSGQRTTRPVGKADGRVDGKGAAGASVVLAPLELGSKHRVTRGGVARDVSPRGSRTASGSSSSRSSSRGAVTSARSTPPSDTLGPQTRRRVSGNSGVGKGKGVLGKGHRTAGTMLNTSGVAAAVSIAVAVGLVSGERSPPAGAAPLPMPAKLLVSKTIKLELPSISRNSSHASTAGANARKGKVRPAPSSYPTSTTSAVRNSLLRSSSGRHQCGEKPPTEKTMGTIQRSGR
ncbi:hypothetical protein B484DRAFT_452414 [Ochromonadaceae sp. CCMP2298]|nr:hypothetical protein B484DRAFT_452414 [Ochromonadaceae sp. CCMP2298]